MDRRRWTMGGVAVMAAGAGVGWSLLGDQPSSDPLWDQRFPTPDGGELVMASLKGRPLVLNFWATWCPPCVREMPALDRFHQRWSGRGWQVLGLALDNAEAVREFLRRQPVSFPIGLAGLAGTTLSRQLGNQTGALPFTAVFDPSGALRDKKLGETSESDLEAWAKSIRT